MVGRVCIIILDGEMVVMEIIMAAAAAALEAITRTVHLLVVVEDLVS